MAAHSQLDPQTSALLREAALWRVLARLFECPDDHWHAEIASAVRRFDIRELRAAASAIDASVTVALYRSVFGPRGGAVPREASYQQTMNRWALFTDLSASYEAFAYAPLSSEPLDHIAVELSFVSYLKFKEAHARADGRYEQAQIAARAADDFIARHLAPIAEPLSQRLDKSCVPYLAHACDFLTARVGARRSLALPPVPEPATGGLP